MPAEPADAERVLQFSLKLFLNPSLTVNFPSDVGVRWKIKIPSLEGILFSQLVSGRHRLTKDFMVSPFLPDNLK